ARPDAMTAAGASSGAPIEATSGKMSAAPIGVSPDAADPALPGKAAAAASAARAHAENGGGGDDSDAPAVAAPSSAQAASVSPPSDASVNLALAEGSDATGATS